MLSLRRKTDNYSFTTQYTPGASDRISRREPPSLDNVPEKEWTEVNQASAGQEAFENHVALLRVFQEQDPDNEEFIREMIEEIEQDVKRSCDISRWPAELETSGSVAEDALRVQRHVQAARVAVNKLPAKVKVKEYN